MSSQVGLISLSLALSACTFFTSQDAGEDRPGGRPPGIGPILVLDLINNSAGEVVVGYEYEAASSSGGGESTVAACQHMMRSTNVVSGGLSITIDGRVVTAEVVPAGVVDGYVVQRIIVDSDGAAEAVGGLQWSNVAPESVTRPIGDCP